MLTCIGFSQRQSHTHTHVLTNISCIATPFFPPFLQTKGSSPEEATKDQNEHCHCQKTLIYA